MRRMVCREARIMSTSLQIAEADTATRDRFCRLTAEWKTRSRYLSNSAQMAMLPPYQRIIGMGDAAVPLILSELQREPDQWFWALEAITEENPVSPESLGKVRAMAEDWIALGRRQGIDLPRF